MISRCLFGEAACVRFGSLADIGQHVRFAPESGHAQRQHQCPLSAKSGHQMLVELGRRFLADRCRTSLWLGIKAFKVVGQRGREMHPF